MLGRYAELKAQLPPGTILFYQVGTFFETFEEDAKTISQALSIRLTSREAAGYAGGRVPLTLHLLSPAHRPVQVTRDLASFWRTTYFDVKKDLKGRYPKHYWPDDPLAATATHRARPRPR